jgi:hypothetical protein
LLLRLQVKVAKYELKVRSEVIENRKAFVVGFSV